MFESDKKDPLDRLRKGLYSRTTADQEAPRHSFHGERIDVRDSWDEPSDTPEEKPTISPERRYGYKILFICSALFLLVAIAYAAYNFFGGGNFISVNNVDIQISGPAQAAGGGTLPLDVSVMNNNPTGIELVDLVVQFPQGAKDPANPSQDLIRSRYSLGDIAAHAVAQQTVSAILYGQQGDQEDMTFTAEYRTANSNAIFYKEKTYHVTISSSPVIVSIDSLDKVTSGAPFDATVTVTSNSTDTIKNTLLEMTYPFGFSVTSAEPSATANGDVWNLGDLAPGAKRTITLHSVLTGQDSENQVIHATVGVESASQPNQIATTIVTQDHTFTIEKPFLGLDLALNGERSDLAAQAGRSVQGDIIWTNNSSSQITNAVITAELSGNALDPSTVSVDNGGFYDSQANTITWQASGDSDLATIAPGATGRVSFTVSSLAPSVSQSISQPNISIAVSAQGNRIDETGAPQSVNTAVIRSIKLASNLALAARDLYSQGPFKNSGPLPPKANQATTYTVVWTVTNTSNTITGAQVTASLPPYVEWTGEVSPSDAAISYSTTTGVVTWVVGDVPANAGYGDVSPEQVAFQISYTPSANQVGTAPDLVGQATITGNDVFTGAALQNSAQSLSTRISTDLFYQPGDEMVQQ
ncbi:MAG: DUF11 domain-containing protein [Patescibacteria group bacterium]|nr:DUF11 domain-containing protein [Patescibacteria group bacterium]MDE2116717.1 DUF11 domain-containing protein [Patescibacteria group bacterium]